MNPIDIAFNDSNLYFQNTDILQSRIGFVSPINIDVFVKKSFAVTTENLLISGAYINVFNSSHGISDTFIVYQIALNNNQPLFQTEGKINFDLENQGLFSGSTIKKTIQSMPIISIMLLTFITFLMPTQIAKIFSYISLVGMIVIIFVYGWKIIKMMYTLLTNKGIDYNGIMVYFENKNDIPKINDTHIQTLKLLNEIKVVEVVVCDNILYFKQEVHTISLEQTLLNIFKKKVRDDTLITNKIQDTINFLLNNSFISLCTQTNNAIETITQD